MKLKTLIRTPPSEAFCLTGPLRSVQCSVPRRWNTGLGASTGRRALPLLSEAQLIRSPEAGGEGAAAAPAYNGFV